MTRYQGEPQGSLPPGAIAIAGMSCRFAGARGLDAYWSLLKGGLEAIEDYDDAALIAAGVAPAMLRNPAYVRRGAPIEDMECFDAALFGLSPRDAAVMDPQHRHFLECAWEAFENAGHVPQSFDGTIGVFAGSGHNAYMPYNLLTNPKLVRDVGLFLLRHTSNDKDFMTTRASYLFDLKGPSINVQTACSTSLVSIHMAAQSLLNGECDMAIAGGASIELPHRQGYLYEEGEILSPDGHCRPFDSESQGTVFGSGVAVVALRRLEDAVEAGDHIWAVIRGSAINNDGSGKVGYLAPSVDGQARVIAEALAIADVGADTIDYVEAHGTGTPVGDPIEVAALTQAFRETTDRRGYCAIGSVKATIGHTDTAAGAAGVIKVALAMHAGERPASLNFTAPNPACAFEQSPFTVQGEHSDWPLADHPRRAGVSSLGVGGTNAHLVMEQAPPRRASGPSRRRQLLLISARSESALRGNVDALRDHLGNPGVNLADTAFTLGTGRQPLAQRRAVVADTHVSAIAALAEPASPPPCIPDRPVSFLFCGAGSQHVDMARTLYDSEPVFRDAVDDGLAALTRVQGPEVRRWLFPVEADREEAAALLERPSIALPALFIIQVALARFWMALGVKPTGMIGHSSGEYAAAHLAGVIDLDSGLRIVSARGALFETVAGGGMLSVPMAEADLLPLLPPELSIAVINGPRLCVVSGPSEAIERFGQTLADREIEAQSVRISVAAHSGMLDPILARFRQLMESIDLRAPRIPFASNLTGDWITREQATDPGYWVRHLRQTVRFTDGLQRLFDDPQQVLLEVGPGRAMSSLARQHPDRKREQPVLSSLPHPDQRDPADEFFWARLGQLWELGVEIDWARYWDGEQRNRIPLPTYRFDRIRHWIEPGAASLEPTEDMERREAVEDWLSEPVWSRAEPIAGEPPVGAALVLEGDERIGPEIAQRLRAAGCAVTTVRPGRRFRELGDGRFEVRPGEAADYARLFERMLGGPPRQVYHCWLTGASPVGQAMERGFYSLAVLAPELARQAGDMPVDFALVTDHAQRVGDERGIVPERAATIGAARVVSTEYPAVRIRCVDIGRGTTAARVIDEMGQPFDPAPVSYRGGERWVLDHAAVRVRPAEPAIPLLRQGATYLITGGLGGLGLTIARHLVERYAANVALVSRTPLPPREQWADLLADDSGDPALADRLRGVVALESGGAGVEIVVADVANASQMKRAVRRVRERFGPIAGVFHAAGTLDDGLLEGRDRSAMDATLRPKVSGVRALETALHREKTGFILLFSSISAFAGLPGQADYAAANAFLDAYAESRREDADTRVIAVGWSQWGDVGMAAALDRATGGILPPVPDEGGKPVDHPFIDRIHATADGYDVVGTLSPATHWLLDEHRVSGMGSLIPGTGYLELARAAHAQVASGPAVMSGITFLSPFGVGDAEARRVRVRLTRRGSRDWRFAVLGKAIGEDDTAWTEHAEGVIGPCDTDTSPTLDFAAIAVRCPALTEGPLGISEVLRFGPRWQNVRQTALGQGEALLKLELADNFQTDLQRVELHPALLDLATAGAQSLIPGYDRANDFFAPFSYGRVVVHHPLPARIVSHVRLRTPGEAATSMAIFDIVIADEAGNVLVEVDEFTMMRVRDPATMAHRQRTRASGANVASSDRLDPILPEQGVAVIDTLLSGDTRSHVIVSPYPLNGLLQRLRAPQRAAGKPRSADPGASPVDLPQTETEQVIAELWEDLLGIEGIGRDDDFFDLGGHSLLAVQFTNRFRKRTGKTLPLAMLLDTPTVANLARKIDPDSAPLHAQERPAPALDGLVRIRGEGDRTPIFFVHDGLGETLLYRGLALRLDGKRPVYGIEPRRTPTGEFAHTSIAQMASDYVQRIRDVQPRGPYLLAGLCAGGVIAFEMARQIEESGDSIAFVGIVDAADVAADKRPFYITRTRLARIGALARESGGVAMLPRLCARAVNAVRWEIASRLNRARERAIVAQMESDGGTADAIPFLKLYEVAHRAHRPRGLLEQGEVALFKATAGTGAIEDIPYREVYSDLALGWGRRVASEIRVVDVPGGHGSTLQEPHVDTLALHFQAAIDRAATQEDHGVPDAAPVPVPVEAAA